MDRSLLGRATEGTDAPTPGYLYVDLAKQATANPAACAEMAQYLTRKLQNKQNPNIKSKCCKVIAKLCEQVPRNQFRRCVAQDAAAVAAIKEAINFRGPMDAVQGDAKNEKVRAAAREALDAVYNEAASSEASVPMQGMSASYGSAPNQSGYGGGPAAAAGGGARKMEGIGNPMYSDPRNDPRYNGTAPTNFVDAVKEAGDIVKGMIRDPLARNVGQPQMDVPNRGHSGNLPGYGNRGSYGGAPPGSAELRAQTNGEWTMASNRGPGAVTGQASNEYYKERDTSFNNMYSSSAGGQTSASAGRVGGSWGAAAAPPVGASSAPNYGTPSVTVNHNPVAASTTVGATSDGTYEKNLIMELCPPGGVKAVPPPDKLANFARSVGSLNPDLICPVLLDLLEEGQPWIIRAKALCVMESAIQNGVAQDGTNPYKTFFFACSEEIQPLAMHPRAAIKEPAKRVLLKLGVTPGPGADPVAAPPVAAAPVAAAPNLLDFDDAPAANPPAAPPSQPPPPPPTQAPPPAPPAAAPAAAPTNNMFGGMTIKGSGSFDGGTPAPAPPAAAPPAAPPASSLLDFTATQAAATPAADPFAASATPAPAPAAAVSATTSMFGELSVKDKPAEPAAAAPAPVAESLASVAPAAGGSAFGFINNAAPAPAAAAPETTTPTPTPPANKATFDPLQGMGGAGSPPTMPMPTAMPTGNPQMLAQPMMALSPEQMQAMAYQQMMMQQQMQQMQMAMAMQQGGRPGVPPPAMQFRTSSGGSTNMSFRGGATAPRPAQRDDKKFDFVKDTMSATMKK